MIEPVYLGRVGKKLPQYVSPCPRGIFLIFCSHVRRAHGASRQMRFAAIAGSIALLRMLQYVLFVKTKFSFKLGCLLPRRISQHGIHRRGIYYFIWIKNIFWIPCIFYCAEKFIIFITYHLFYKLTTQSSIAMFAAE